MDSSPAVGSQRLGRQSADDCPALHRPCQVSCITDPLLYTLSSSSTYPLYPHLTTNHPNAPSHSPSPSWLYPSHPLSWLSPPPSLKLHTFLSRLLFANKACPALNTGRRPSQKIFNESSPYLYTHTISPLSSLQTAPSLRPSFSTLSSPSSNALSFDAHSTRPLHSGNGPASVYLSDLLVQRAPE